MAHEPVAAAGSPALGEFSMDALEEGDVVCFRSAAGCATISLTAVSCLPFAHDLLPAFAPVVSHIGIMLRFGGELWLCEAHAKALVAESEMLHMPTRPLARVGVCGSRCTELRTARLAPAPPSDPPLS